MVFCPNCHCEIEDSKYVLHERYCRLTVKYCDKCEESFPIEEFEQHVLKHDKPEFQGLQRKKSKIEKEESSLKRVQSCKIPCEFCELYLYLEEIEEHQKMCGARTTNCPECNKLIMYKDLQNHLKNEHKKEESKKVKFEDSKIKKGLTESLVGNMSEEEQINYAIQKSLESNNNKPNDKIINEEFDLTRKISERTLNKMSEDEQLAYALKQSEFDFKGNANDISNKNKTREKSLNEMTKEERIAYAKSKAKEKVDVHVNKQKSIKVDYDAIDNELEEEIYNQEMENYGNEDI